MMNEMTAEEAVKILRFEQEQVEHRLDGYSDTQENRNIYEAFRMAIKALEPKWIPVSERLPEVGKKVLCQCQANIYEVLKLTVDGWYHDENHCYMLGFVIAWMPLPEPYKSESEVKDDNCAGNDQNAG